MRWSPEHYAKRFPQYNRTCAECGAAFNALALGSKARVTCSRECSRAHALRLQRENTRRYVRSEAYKAYRVRYYEAVKARRRLARIGAAIAGRPGGEDAAA